jgi:alpha-methylacyl-CoA racemase
MADATEIRPLRGIRVLSLAVNIPGPVAAARLHALGAEVTKVEPPAGDPLAAASPGWYAALTQGQDVMTLDLKEEGGRGRLDEMLSDRDLLLTAIRPAALERLGLSARSLTTRHPRLCTVAVTGYPAPDADRAGHDLTYQAEAGLVRPPELPPTLTADLAAAERAVGTALALLLGRERTGAAGHAEVPIAEAASAFADPLRFGLTHPGGVLGGGLPVYALYRAADRWIALAAIEPHFIGRLMEALDLPDLQGDALQAVFLARPAEEWERWARERDLPIAAVRERDAAAGSDGAHAGWGSQRT